MNDFDLYDEEYFDDEDGFFDGTSEFDECPKCGGDLVSSSINRGTGLIIRTDICVHCGYIYTETEATHDFDLDSQYEDRFMVDE
jgi:ssDNA-binding Zn-finger/Zn-ribbon topoisomerase 1